MSMGTPVTTVRIPQDLLNEVKYYLDKRSTNPVVEPWSLTDFIVRALKDKLDHLARSAKTRKSGTDSSELIDLGDIPDVFTPSNHPIVMGEKPS